MIRYKIFCAIMILLVIVPSSHARRSRAKYITMDENVVEIDVNQLGYLVGFPKSFVLRGISTENMPFELHADGKSVYKGVTKSVAAPPNWRGNYHAGDFSEFNTRGKYTVVIQSEGKSIASVPFVIDSASKVYKPALAKTMEWFKSKRCGPGNKRGHGDFD